MVRIGQYAEDGKTLLYVINSDRLEDTPELCRVIKEVRAELRRREPPEAFIRKLPPNERRNAKRAGYHDCWSQVICKPRHHDLAKRIRLAYEAAEAKAAARGNLEVKEDLATILFSNLMVLNLPLPRCHLP